MISSSAGVINQLNEFNKDDDEKLSKKIALRECAKELNHVFEMSKSETIRESINYLDKINSEEIKLEWSNGSQKDLEKINLLRKLLKKVEAEKIPEKYKKETHESIDALLVVFTRFWPMHLKFDNDKGCYQSYSAWEDITDQNRILTIKSGIQLTTQELKTFVESKTLFDPIDKTPFSQSDINYLLKQAERHKIEFKPGEELSQQERRFILIYSIAHGAIDSSMITLLGALMAFFIKPIYTYIYPYMSISIACGLAAFGFSIGAIGGYFFGKKRLRVLTEPIDTVKGEENQKIDFLLSSIMRQVADHRKKMTPNQTLQLSSVSCVIEKNMDQRSDDAVRISIVSPAASADHDVDSDEMRKEQLEIEARAAIQSESQIRKRFQ